MFQISKIQLMQFEQFLKHKWGLKKFYKSGDKTGVILEDVWIKLIEDYIYQAKHRYMVIRMFRTVIFRSVSYIMEAVMHGYKINFSDNLCLALYVADLEPLDDYERQFYIFSPLVPDKMFTLIWTRFLSPTNAHYKLNPYVKEYFMEKIFETPKVFKLLS